MAKGVTRVNGRSGELMEAQEDVITFRTGGHTHEMERDGITLMRVMNAEEARSFVSGCKDKPLGLWVYNDMPSSNGKTVFLIASDGSTSWVMELNKSQGANAVKLAHEVCPVQEHEEEEEIKLYAAIQTPLGAVFAIGSIACALGAYAVLSVFEQPIIALILAGASIAMFIHAK